MGRNRSRKDEDRFLIQRAGNYHYKRRVPTDLAHLDARAPHVRMSLRTDDPGLARRKRDQLEAADDALWASLKVDGVTDPARRRYDAAVRRVEALDFSFQEARLFENADAFRSLVERVRVVLDRQLPDPVAKPIFGIVEVPKTTITQAFILYCEEIVADELVNKSKLQRAQWRKVKQRAVNNLSLIHI